MRNGIVIVKIGCEGTSYYLHKRLLAQYSDYFDRAFNHGWKEAEGGLITLEDVDCGTCTLTRMTRDGPYANLEIVNVFVHWLYTQRLPAKYSDWIENFTSHMKLKLKTFQMSMLKARKFADQFLVTAFGNVVECALVIHFVEEDFAFYDVVTYAYEHLRYGSPILTAIVHAHCLRFDDYAEMTDKSSGEIDTRKNVPLEFLEDVMLRYMRITKEGVKNEMQLCDYHEHDSAAETNACYEAWLETENDLENDLDEGFEDDLDENFEGDSDDHVRK